MQPLRQNHAVTHTHVDALPSLLKAFYDKGQAQRKPHISSSKSYLSQDLLCLHQLEHIVIKQPDVAAISVRRRATEALTQ